VEIRLETPEATPLIEDGRSATSDRFPSVTPARYRQGVGMVLSAPAHAVTKIWAVTDFYVTAYLYSHRFYGVRCGEKMMNCKFNDDACHIRQSYPIKEQDLLAKPPVPTARLKNRTVCIEWN